jgi:cysteine synthase
MNLDEALAVYHYLQFRSQTNTTVHERTMRQEAWKIICKYADIAIRRAEEGDRANG